MNILELEKCYCNHYLQTFEELTALNKELEQNCLINLEDSIISKAILYRMIKYYEYHNKLKEFLDKGIVAAAADYFVETVLFYLRFIFSKQKPEFHVCSEKAIIKKRGSIRPDISIWKDEELVAIIECKTQLGYNRENWKRDFHERERTLKESFPNAQAYLLVMSLSNWKGFGDNEYLRSKYFLLTKYWPGSMTSMPDDAIETPIEVLANKILNQ